MLILKAIANKIAINSVRSRQPDSDNIALDIIISQPNNHIYAIK
jgi:hypothetical protein